MVNGLTVLIAYLFMGDIISTIFALPIPGAIIGMLLLLLTLIVRQKTDKGVKDASNALISYIGLLFVPAGAGISQHFSLLAQEWLLILTAGISIMLLTLSLSALLFGLLSKEEEM